MFRDGLRAVLDLLAPRRCAACELELLALERGFCDGCGILLDEVPVGLRPPARSASAFVYGGPLAHAIRGLKYAGRTDVAPVLGELLADSARAYGGRVDVVVPVPLHARRLRERGFNQAALLAAPVARSLGVPLDVRRLRRTRDTSTQASLVLDQRPDNVRGAFLARADERRPRVLLVDDVRTTGATLAAARQALQRAGAAEVFCFTLARVI